MVIEDPELNRAIANLRRHGDQAVVHVIGTIAQRLDSTLTELRHLSGELRDMSTKVDALSHQVAALGDGPSEE